MTTDLEAALAENARLRAKIERLSNTFTQRMITEQEVELERLRTAIQISIREIHMSHPREPGCMPGCGPLHLVLL